VNVEQLKTFIYEVPDFPKPGVGFKDIAPLVRDAAAYNFVVDRLLEWARPKRPEIVVGLGLDVIRKKGKLPRKTISVRAPNEYAVEIFEMHADTILPGQRTVIIDDLIATGSSSIAAIDLVRLLKGEPVGFGAVIDLGFLDGVANIRRAHPEVDVFSLVHYD
jgi:adenine/guanine phosphoribosyltransferase-like PRPP-binding protein